MTVIFFGILVILAILSAIATYTVIKEERSNNKLILEQKERLEKIENELTGKNLELEKAKKQILEIKDELLINQDAFKKENLNKIAIEKKAQELENQLNTQTSELKKQLKQDQEALKKEGADKLSLEKKLQEAQAQLANKDTALKTEQMAHQEIKEKYESLFPPPKAGDPASS